MKEAFDPDYMNKMSSAERAKRFVPTEEIPDPRSNPSETLMLKEEAPSEVESEVVKKNGHLDLNDLARVPSYLEKTFPEKKLPELTISPQDQPDEVEKIVDEAEKQLLKDTEPDIVGRGDKRPYKMSARRSSSGEKTFKFSVIDSHGPRGRKPTRKISRRSKKTIW